MKRNFTYVLTLLAAFLSMNMLSTAQVVQTESFTGITMPPAGWTTIYSGATLYFTRQTTGTFPTCSPNSAPAMARYNSRTSPAGTTQFLITPAFDLSSVGTDTARVSLWVFRDDSLATAYDSMSVLFNTVADTTGAIQLGTIARSRFIALPDTEAAPGWYQYTFDMPLGFNGTTNHILFRFYTGSGNNTGYRIFFDDISWDTYPAICNGMPTAGLVVPSRRVVCGGPNVVSLSDTGSTSELGITYLWQSSPDGVTFTDFGTATSTVTTDTLFATTYFRCAVICTTSGDTAYTAVDSVVVSPDPVPSVTVSPTAANYCVNSGTPAMLVASGGVRYSWTPSTTLSSATADTVYATPNNSTTYTVTGFDTYGCFDTAMVRVTIRQTPTVTATPATASTCIGDSITLSASSTGIGGGGTTVTYTWTPGGLTGASIRVPVDSNITYYVTGVTNFGCSGPQSTDTVVIEALPTPVAGDISAVDTVICGGPGVTTLTLVNGTSGSAAITYSWMSSSSDTGTWTPLSATTSSFTTDTLFARTYFMCVVSCASGSADTTLIASVNVSPDPAPVVSIPSSLYYYCNGMNATELIASGASSYVWTPSAGLSSTTSDTVYASPVNSTGYTVTGYDSFGCKDTAVTRVFVRQIPVVTVTPLSSTICHGDSVTLSASFTVTGNGAGTTTLTYTWEPGGLTGQSITVTPDSSIDYVVTGISNYGCTGVNSVDTASLTVNQLTVAGFTSMDMGFGLYMFGNNSENATSYLWDFGTGDTTSNDNPNYTFPASGVYPVTLIATGLCNSDTVSDTLNVIIDAISTVKGNTLFIGPNPAHDLIRLVSDGNVQVVEMTDLLGNVLYTRKVVSASELYDVRRLNAGIYFFRVHMNDRTQVIRFVKE